MGGPTGSGNFVSIAGLAISPRGDIVVAGRFNGTVGFGGAPLEPYASVSISDGPPLEHGFVVAFDDTGKERWHVELSRTTGFAPSIAVDRDGDVIVAGSFLERAELGAIAIDGAEDGVSSAFVGKIGPEGTPRWLVRVADPQGAQASSVAVDADGNTFVVGPCASTPSIGKLVGTQGAAFMAAISPDGDPTWLHVAKPPIGAMAVAADGHGHVLVTGAEGPGQADLGLGPLPAREAAGVYLAELDAKDGTPRDQFPFATTTTTFSSGEALVTTPDGHAMIAGTCNGSLGLGETKPPGGPAPGDLFLARVAR
jgi:outer membrane protein assembly factor BamB